MCEDTFKIKFDKFNVAFQHQHKFATKTPWVLESFNLITLVKAN